MVHKLIQFIIMMLLAALCVIVLNAVTGTTMVKAPEYLPEPNLGDFEEDTARLQEELYQIQEYIAGQESRQQEVLDKVKK